MENISKRAGIKTGTIDFKRKIKLCAINEKGFILFQNLIALSVILILLTAIGGIIYQIIKISREIKGDLELTRELSYVMERITEDANLADKVKLSHLNTRDSIFIEYRKTPYESKFNKVSYGQMDAPTPGLSRIIVDSETAPITGDSKLGNVNITKFKIKKISSHLFELELEGISRVTNHTYTIKTTIYTQGEVTE